MATCSFLKNLFEVALKGLKMHLKMSLREPKNLIFLPLFVVLNSYTSDIASYVHTVELEPCNNEPIYHTIFPINGSKEHLLSCSL